MILHLTKKTLITPFFMQSGVRCSAATPDGQFIMSGASRDSTLAIFSSRLENRKGEGGSPSKPSKIRTRRSKLCLSAQEAPISVACAACGAQGDESAQGECSKAFVAAAVTEGGNAFVWRCSKEDAKWQEQLRCAIRPHSSQEPVLGISFESEHGVRPFSSRNEAAMLCLI
jgi:hypothetical protein